MDIKRKWQRFKNDYKNGLFFKHPFELNIIEHQLENWLKEIDEKFKNDSFQPSDMQICEVPKGNGLLRPGSILKTEDVLYLIHLVSESFNEIFEHLKWSQGKIDFSYILNEEGKTEFKWLSNQYKGWEDFRKESINLIEEGNPYVIITDITGYYENIHIKTLFEDLRAANVDVNTASKIKKCLDKWSINQGKGIPQSIEASHILGKLYLNNIDLAMNNKGFKMIRYVDDMRIFCKTKTEAKQALMYLNQLMRDRGLNLQSAKTKIHRADEALDIIEGVQKIIQNVEAQINSQLPIMQADYIATDLSSFDIDDATQINEGYNDSDLDTLKATFSAYFLDDNPNFDKTLFRYLINRIGISKDKIGLEYCLRNLEKHPQETNTFLKYFLAIEAIDEVINSLFEFLQSDDAIYSYQKYQIINWINNNVDSIENNHLKTLRTIVNNSNNPKYLISISRASISKFGNIADLDELMGKYSDDLTELEKIEILCSIKNVEKTKRNSFYGQKKDESKITENTIKWIKENDS